MVLASAFGALLLFNSIYKYGYTNTHIYNIKYTYHFITYVYMYIYIGISFSAGPDSWDPPISPTRVGRFWRNVLGASATFQVKVPESPTQSVMPCNNQLKWRWNIFTSANCWSSLGMLHTNSYWGYRTIPRMCFTFGGKEVAQAIVRQSYIHIYVYIYM